MFGAKHARFRTARGTPVYANCDPFVRDGIVYVACCRRRPPHTHLGLLILAHLEPLNRAARRMVKAVAQGKVAVHPGDRVRGVPATAVFIDEAQDFGRGGDHEDDDEPAE